MKAIALPQPGPPEVLRLAEVPEPTLRGDRDVKVRLIAAGVNPIDTKLRKRGTFFPDRYPAILGCDGAGIITEVGSAITSFKVGDEVFFCQGGLGDRPGTYAEYAVVPEYCLAQKPKSLSFIEAAALPLVAITAWESLCDRGGYIAKNTSEYVVQPNQTVLIHGGAGGVAHIAIQLARLFGARVATTVSSTHKAEFAERLGAEHCINYHQTDWVEAAFEWTHRQGLDLILDTVGGETFNQSIQAVRLYGTLVTLLEPGNHSPWNIARQRNLVVRFTLMLTPELAGLRNAPEHQAYILQQVGHFATDGRLMIKVDKTFPLGAAADAHHYLESGAAMGKIVLTI